MRVGIHNPISEEESVKVFEIGKKIILKAYDESFWNKIEINPFNIDIKRGLVNNEYEYRIHYSIEQKPIYIWVNTLEKSFWFVPLFYRKSKLNQNKEKKIIGLISDL